MRRLGLAIVPLILIGCLTGGMISSQEGEKTHVNAPDPDQIVFHFDTSFNKTLLVLRSTALLALGVWFFRARGSGGGNVLMTVLVVVFAVGAAGTYFVGHRKVAGYRIELAPAGLELNLPARTTTRIEWNDIEGIDGEGEATDVSFGGPTMWSTDWERLTIHLRGGEKIDMDLKPLSYEQRGTLWRAIARFADIEIQTWVEQTRN